MVNQSTPPTESAPNRAQRPRLLVFSDLDGTLLDAHDYDWSAAQPALDRLAGAGIPLVLSSSKTAAEMAWLQAAMGLRLPAIVENGAAVVLPADGHDAPRVHVQGAPRDDVLAELARRRAAGARFRGFNDMTAAEIAELTGLDADAAARAKDRAGTEPLVWQGSDDELNVFREALANAGFRLVQGGRFWHAMGQFDKADGARFLLDRYRAEAGDAPLITIALGDSPNDQGLLDLADIPVVIRGRHSDELAFTSDRRAMRSLRPGPQGWNDCVLNLLFEYGY